MLSAAEARTLLDGIDISTIVGLRDRALIGVMVYSFARVSAVTGMRRGDYFSQGRRGWLRLHEKGGKRHDVPAHHLAETYLDAYLEAGAIADPKAPLFQSVDRARRLTGRAIQRREVLAMIKRRAAAADLPGGRVVTRFGRRASPPISRTAGLSSTPSRFSTPTSLNRSPRTPPRKQPSSTTAHGHDFAR